MNRILVIAGGVLALAAVPAAAWQIDRAINTVSRADVQAKAKARFAAIDADKDGVVTAADIARHRETMTTEEAARRRARREQLFTALDSDRNGQLSQAEFAAPRAGGDDGDMRGDHRRGRGRHGGGPTGMRDGRGERGDWIARADADKDGRLTLAEASAQALARFDAADANRDGKLTPDERRAARAARRGGPKG